MPSSFSVTLSSQQPLSFFFFLLKLGSDQPTAERVWVVLQGCYALYYTMKEGAKVSCLLAESLHSGYGAEYGVITNLQFCAYSVIYETSTCIHFL